MQCKGAHFGSWKWTHPKCVAMGDRGKITMSISLFQNIFSHFHCLSVSLCNTRHTQNFVTIFQGPCLIFWKHITHSVRVEHKASKCQSRIYMQLSMCLTGLRECTTDTLNAADNRIYKLPEAVWLPLAACLGDLLSIHKVPCSPVALHKSPGTSHIHSIPGIAETVILKPHSRLVARRFGVPLDHHTVQASITATCHCIVQQLQNFRGFCHYVIQISWSQNIILGSSGATNWWDNLKCKKWFK